MGLKENFNSIKKNYLSIAEKFFYGELPLHLYNTEIIYGSSPTNDFASGSDCVHNMIYIHPDIISKEKDLEWTIFHEMEHLRLARDLGNDQSTGFYTKYEHGTGEALNEGITEIAVENMLQRKLVGQYGYYETTQLVRQIFALLGKDDIDVMEYCTISGKDKFIEDFRELTGLDVFPILDNGLQNVHDWHLNDILKEYEEFGEVKTPLGKYCSDKTKSSRIMFHDKVLSTIIQLAGNKGNISQEELHERVDRMEKLSPYKNGELDLNEKSL